MKIDDKILNKLFKLAEKSYRKNEFPVAAIVFEGETIISTGYNRRNRTKKTTDHAEIIAIQKANKKLKNWNLEGKSMIVTLEPCEMCTAVLKEARLKEVFYIVPRYNYKKQYKKTSFKEFPLDNEMTSIYRQNMSTFFVKKR